MRSRSLFFKLGLLLFACISSVWADDFTYTIQSDDILVVTVFDQPDLSVTARVTAGEITMPLIESVSVKGMTIPEAENKIRGLLAKDYLVDPHVQIFIKQYHTDQITVLGGVKKPGKFIVSPDKPTTLLDAIAMANGVTDNANTDHTSIMRMENDRQRIINIKLSEIINGKDIILKPNDIIFVEKVPIKQLTVLGAVKNPGKYDMFADRDTSLLEAIGLANGFVPYADIEKTEVIRTENGGKTIIPININDIVHTGMKDKDIPLKPGDIIYVGEMTPQLTVLGAVKNPGKYDMFPDRDTSLLEAISMANGFLPDANIDKTKVIRTENGVKKIIPININDIVQAGMKDEDISLKPGDVVYVEGLSQQLTVLGEVNKPGKYNMYNDRDTTLLDAIALAQGFTDFAAINGTRILRTINGKQETIKIKVSDITKKGMKEKDIVLKDGDVVIVPESFF